MTKLDRLVQAIIYHEGWINSIDRPADGGSISYRNHNPGNLRSSLFQAGTKGGFAVFNSDEEGLFALKYDLIKKARGETVTGLNSESTLRQLIYKYAPPGDNNNTERYLMEVINMTGLPETMPLKELLP